MNHAANGAPAPHAFDDRSADSIMIGLPRLAMRSWRAVMLALPVSAILVAPALAGDPPKQGLPGVAHFQFRLRAESVDEAAFQENATATTLRTRLTWTSPRRRGWQAAVEVDDIRALDPDAYDSTVNGRTNRPVIADPADTELNRAVLEWKQTQFDLALGRQRLALDNQRFVGNVGWRQNEQSFDAATLRWHPTVIAELTLVWISNVNRVFGPRSGTQAANWHGDAVIVHGRSDFGRFGALTAFWHGMDFDNAATSSVSTAGVLWTGVVKPGGGWQLPWTVSLASQRDYAGNPSDYSAAYRQLEFGVTRGPATLRLGLESLGGDATQPNRRFQTPLATLHAFQGWADKFLVTPPQGVKDRYVTLEASFRGTQVLVSRHDFRAEAVEQRFGHEWDISASRKIGTRYELLGKFADYTADGLATDTRKAWLMLTVTL